MLLMLNVYLIFLHGYVYEWVIAKGHKIAVNNLYLKLVKFVRLEVSF